MRSRRVRAASVAAEIGAGVPAANVRGRAGIWRELRRPAEARRLRAAADSRAARMEPTDSAPAASAEPGTAALLPAATGTAVRRPAATRGIYHSAVGAHSASEVRLAHVFGDAQQQ